MNEFIQLLAASPKGVRIPYGEHYITYVIPHKLGYLATFVKVMASEVMLDPQDAAEKLREIVDLSKAEAIQ